MAEVLSPIISPQPDHTTMLQGRTSSGEAFQPAQTHQNHHSQSHSQAAQRHPHHHHHHHQHHHTQQQQQQQQHLPRSLQMPRNHLNHPTGYRGATTAAPIPQYAFKSTPQLRNDSRSPPAQPLSSDNSSAGNRQRYPTSAASVQKAEPTPNSVLINRPYSQAHLPPPAADSSSISNGQKTFVDGAQMVHNHSGLTLFDAQPAQAKNPNGKVPNGIISASFTLPELEIDSSFTLTDTPPSKPTVEPVVTEVVKPAQSAAHSNTPRRYRRQSSSASVDSVNRSGSGSASPQRSQQITSRDGPPSSSLPERSEGRPSSSASSSNHRQSNSSGRNEPVAAATGRTFASADAIRRTNNPSPLSRPVSGGSSNSPTDGNGPSFASTNPNSAIAQSPAVAAMAALNMGEKDANKGVKSRLRRAFSFGSAAELKRATVEADSAEERAKARKEQFSNELDEEQSAIAAQQEAAGLGNSIYSGQGNFFTGSTDNLSISSTASSASMMLRKMGRGMKKGGRSLKGLFRPKSVIGVPPPDEPVQPSVGPISMVTVEAERQQVNVNADPRDQVGGGTGFPRLERNSLDAGQTTLTAAESTNSRRKSFVGGVNDRPDVLAAAKKGILKRSVTEPPTWIPNEQDAALSNPPLFNSPGLERKGSPSPSTTSSEPRRTGHRRTDSSTLEGDDYFASVPRIPGNQSSRSLPTTPRGTSRNISFSPRIQFHDAWSSSEYDRRGDIATCNRLTPMLAQQIKEELNTFKMEMEIHEDSKPHTHFF